MPATGSTTDSQPIKNNPVSQNLGARHLRRVESMLTRGSYMIFAQAGGWAIFAALYAHWLVASMSAAGVLSACATMYLLKQGKIAQASAVLLTSLLIITKLEQYDEAGATAIAVVLLVISFAMLLLINLLERWSKRYYA